MGHSAHSLWLPRALQPRLICYLGCLLLGGILVVSGCRPGGQGTLPNGGNMINELDSIAALSASDAWAVGWASGRGASPLIEHWNGRAWSVVPAPGRGDKSFLNSVTAHSAEDVWAVGEFFKGADRKTLIEHWDGNSWSIIASPNGPGDNDLGGVAVVSATDVWAVGATIPCPQPSALAVRQQGNALARERSAAHASDCTNHPYPLIEHWNGRDWSIVANPPLDPKATGADLANVAAFGKDDIWATGLISFQNADPPTSKLLAEHWDGTAWSMMPDLEQGFEGEPDSLFLLSSSNVWGVKGGASHIIEHWDGNIWSVVAGPSFGSGDYIVETMAASAPDDLWAGGIYVPSQQPGGQLQVFSMHWNGSAWSLVPCPSPSAYPAQGTLPGGNITLTASASRSQDDAWMVGYYYPSNNTQLTFIEHWDGYAWSLVPNPNPGEPTLVGT